MSATLQAAGVGARLEPPAVIIDYIERATGRRRRRIIPVRRKYNETPTQLLDMMRLHHETYLDCIGETKVLQALQALVDAMDNVKEGNLNVLPDEVLEAKKKEMDADFERNRVSKDSTDFEYDVQKEFGPAKEASGWDSDGSEDSEW
ncbi:hypothetical protein PTSG_01009 [Salpingoeca rosetta]|uniref:Centrosomal protein of 19 kDa n=1 Tax=Salpingoeca rosetta (strain ATCC 50818 / BSB-021) TaxID=946362 RepID=F2TY48_SALR5|nr:uncharacterized protein PTSG_01009 [Salpingoeca rosetta]EGD76307.1 hypothetical protein PTSG_01009 [Salpingoeca rosetta]|eukprot:XP_004998482.1 hypothetical protein PTSG_01009 [Salpingoeca rosetta]